MNRASGESNPRRRDDRSRRRPVFWTGAAIAAAALAAYANTFRVPFLADDRAKIVDNESLKNLRHWGEILSPRALTLVGRPLLSLTFALNYAWSGERVWSYHALNLAIHILAGLTLFGITRRTLQSLARARHGPLGGKGGPDTARPTGASPTLFAFVTALLWTVHPLLTEAVTYVSQRAESLMGLFYLLTLYGFIRGVEAGGAGAAFARWASAGAKAARRTSLFWFGVSWLACFFGMATKEAMVTAPLLVLLYDRTFAAGSLRGAVSRRRGYYLGLCSSWLLLGFLLGGSSLEQRGAGFHVGVGAGTYGLTELKAVATYAKLSLWPHPLVFDYGSEALVTRMREAAPSALLVLGMAAAAALAWRRSKPLGFVAASFFLLLLPTSSFVPIALQPMAESRMYLPLACVMTLVGAASCRWGGRRALAALAIAAVVLGTLTVRRNRVYRSALDLWEDTVSRQPASSRGQCSLAVELAKIPGRSPEAIEHYEQALRIRPNLPEAHYGLAFALAKIPGRRAEAIAHYEQALRFNPNYAEAHNSLAVELARIPGRLPEALEHFQQALRLNPNYADAHNNLANELAMIPGRMPEALEHYEQALRLEPGNSLAHYNLANKLARIPGRMPEALEHYGEALRLNPHFPEAHFGLAVALSKIPGRLPDAIAHYEEALLLNPDYAEAHNNLAVAYAASGNRAEAIRHLELALKLNPAYGAARSNLETIQGAR